MPADRLSDYEVRNLLPCLKSINQSPHWRSIESHLGFTTEELDEIERDKKMKDKLFKSKCYFSGHNGTQGINEGVPTSLHILI